MRILIVEDEEDLRDLIRKHLIGKGYKVDSAGTLGDGRKLLSKQDYALVILDLLLPDGNGMDLLKEIKESSPLTEVILLTGHGTIKTAVDAMKLSAYDFLTKPCSLRELEVVVEKALMSRGIKRENLLYKKEQALRYGDFVFYSPVMLETIKKVERIACSDCPVLITGESGVGKEVIASLIHKKSDRSERAMVALNVASVPKDLIEAELFGYEKGAFTGADRSKEGFFELADGGTLFLDEIGEMEISLQAKLLRAIETKRFYRVGGRKEIESDVRIITATNRDLKKLVEEGKFREDLFYRLNVVEIHVPPLRERREDIIPLALHFLEVFSRKYSKRVKGISRGAERMLLTYPWHGNVRELKNVIERAVIFCEGDTLREEDLSCLVREEGETKVKTMREVEKEYILEVLKMVNNNKKRASEILGIPLRTLYRKLSALGIE